MKPCVQRIYHYNYANKDNDSGFGCVYRNLQTTLYYLGCRVPSLSEMMKLVGIDETSIDLKSKWIEPVDAKHICGVVCPSKKSELVLYTTTSHATAKKKMYRTNLSQFDKKVHSYDVLQKKIKDHLEATKGIPIVIDNGISSYAIIGYNKTDTFIIADPHANRPIIRTFDFQTDYHPMWMLLFIS